MKDPNRPRFTRTEMAQVLEERDNSKMKIMELEDELEELRGYYCVLKFIVIHILYGTFRLTCRFVAWLCERSLQFHSCSRELYFRFRHIYK